MQETISEIVRSLSRTAAMTMLLVATLWPPAAATSHSVTGRRDEARFDYYYFAALSRAMMGHDDEAFELARRAVAADSTSAAACLLMADSYQQMGDPQRALTWARRATAIDSTHFWYGSTEAQLLQMLGRPAEAIACYERLARLFPDKVDVYYELAGLYQQLDSTRLCLAALDKIEDLEGIDTRLTMHKFYIRQHTGDTEGAFAEFSKLIDRFPYEASYRILMGDLLLQAGRRDEAKRAYDAAARLEPDNARLMLSLSNYYAALGRTARADSLIHTALVSPTLEVDAKLDILTNYLSVSLRKLAQEKARTHDSVGLAVPGADTLFATVAALHPTAPEVYALEAEYLNAVGRRDEARARMRYAVDLRPADSTYWEKYLYMQMQAADTMALQAAAREALTHCPALFIAYMALSYAYTLLGDLPQELATYEEALVHLAPYDVRHRSTIYGYIGSVYHRMQQMDKAYAAYEEALKLWSENISVLNDYSYFLSLEKRDLDKAERMSSIVIKKKPDEPTYLDTYAWIYFQQGNYSLARFYQERALSKASDNVSATLLEHYGDILYMSGDADEAMKYWQQAAALPDSDSPDLPEKIRTGRYIESQPEWLRKR